MKNLRLALLALIATLMSFAVKAQYTKDTKGYLGGFGKSALTTFNVPYRDTITNSQSKSRTSTIKGSKTDLAFQVNVNRISGTAAGYIQYQTSLDTGATFFTFRTDTLTNTSGVKAYYCVPRLYLGTINPGQVYKVVYTGTGTGVMDFYTIEMWRNDL